MTRKNRPKTRAGTSSEKKDKDKRPASVPFEQLEAAIDQLDQSSPRTPAPPAEKPRKGPPPPPPKKATPPARTGLDSLLPDDESADDKPKKPRAATEKPKGKSLDDALASLDQSYPSTATKPPRAPSVEIDMSDDEEPAPPAPSPAAIAASALAASGSQLQAPDDSYPPLVGPEPLAYDPSIGRRTPVPPPKRSLGPAIEPVALKRPPEPPPEPVAPKRAPEPPPKPSPEPVAVKRPPEPPPPAKQGPPPPAKRPEPPQPVVKGTSEPPPKEAARPPEPPKPEATRRPPEPKPEATKRPAELSRTILEGREAAESRGVDSSSRGREASAESRTSDVGPLPRGREADPSSRGRDESAESRTNDVGSLPRGREVDPSSRGSEVAPSSRGRDIAGAESRARDAGRGDDASAADPWLQKRDTAAKAEVDPWLEKREAVASSDHASKDDPWLRKARDAVAGSDDATDDVDPWLRKAREAVASTNDADATPDPDADPWLRKRDAVAASGDAADEVSSDDPWLRKREAVVASVDAAGDEWLRRRDAVGSTDGDAKSATDKPAEPAPIKQPRTVPPRPAPRPGEVRMTGAQRIVSTPDPERAASGDPRTTAERGGDPRMTGAQRVVPPTAERGGDPRTTGAQRVVPPTAERGSDPRAARVATPARGVAVPPPVEVHVRFAQPSRPPKVVDATRDARSEMAARVDAALASRAPSEVGEVDDDGLRDPRKTVGEPENERISPPAPVEPTRAASEVGDDGLRDPRLTLAEGKVDEKPASASQPSPATDVFSAETAVAGASYDEARAKLLARTDESRTVQPDAAQTDAAPGARPIVDTPRMTGSQPVVRADAPRMAVAQPVVRPDAPGSQPVVRPDAPRMTGSQPVVRPDVSRMTGSQPVVRPDAPRTTAGQPVVRPDAPRTTGAQPVVRPDAPRMTGSQPVVRADVPRLGGGRADIEPPVVREGTQRPLPSDAPRAARPTGEQRGANDPRMTGAQRVVPPDAPRAARPTGDQSDPRMTGAQRVAPPDAPRAARPTGEQHGTNDPRSTPTIGVPRSIPRQEAVRSEPRIAAPKAPGVGWASDAYDEEAIADAERAAASGLTRNTPREPAAPPPRPQVPRAATLGVGWARDADMGEVTADVKRAEQSGLLRLDELQPPPRDPGSSGAMPGAQRPSGPPPDPRMRRPSAAPPDEPRGGEGGASGPTRAQPSAPDDPGAGSIRAQRPSDPTRARRRSDAPSSGRVALPSEAPLERSVRADAPSSGRVMLSSEAPLERSVRADAPSSGRVMLPSEAPLERKTRTTEAPPSGRVVSSEAPLQRSKRESDGPPSGLIVLPSEAPRSQRESDGPASGLIVLPSEPPTAPPSGRVVLPSEAPLERVARRSDPPIDRAGRPSDAPDPRTRPSEGPIDPRTGRPSEPPVSRARPSEPPDARRSRPSAPPIDPRTGAPLDPRRSRPSAAPPPPPGSAQRAPGDDGIVVEHDVPSMRALSIAIHDTSSFLGPAGAAIRLAGHDVAASATGVPGIDQIMMLLRAGTIDAVVVGIPGGEVLIDTASAMEPRPVVIAVFDGNSVDAVRKAGTLGADLAITRPLEVEKLAPVLLAASRLDEERKSAPRAKGSEARARLDALVDAEPGSLQPFEQFQRVMDLELKRSKRYGYPIAVALFVVEVPEEPPPGMRGILRARAGNALIQTIRDIDMATEIDQERFLVLLPYTSLTGAAEVARRIIAEVASLDPVMMVGRAFQPRLVGAVAGAAAGQPLSFSRLMRDATQALEQARRDGAELAVPLIPAPENDA